MTTAHKVINERIAILDNYLRKNAFNQEPSAKHYCNESLKAKDLFDKLLLAIDEYTNLKNGSGDQEIISDLAEKIKEIAGSTMIPLVEHNKQSVNNYKKIIADMSQQKIDLEEKIKVGEGAGPLPAGHEALKEELNNINNTMLHYDKTKKELLEYVDEYEKALEEIKELVMTPNVSDIIQNTISEASQFVDPEATKETNNPELYDSQNQSNDNDDLQGNGVKVYD